MRILGVLLGVLLAGSLSAAPKTDVKILLIKNDSGYHTGSVVAHGEITYQLTIAPCDLPIAGAQNMYHMEEGFRRMTGCWFQTMDGEVTVIEQSGFTSHQPFDLEVWTRGHLEPNGDVIITEPNYDARTFFDTAWSRVIRRKFKESQDALAPR